MGLFSGSTKIAFGFGLGVAAAGVVKEILPVFRGMGRPLLKATVKSGLILANNSRTRLAEFQETLADVTAEAQAELAAMPAQPADAPAGLSPDQPFTKTAKQGAGIM